MPDLYPAQINGIPLQIESIDDTFEKSIVRHEFPYRDGALLEDLGQKARLVKFRCYFWDDGAAEIIFSDGTSSGGGNYTYNDHIELLNLLANQSLFSLVHPKYGTIKGCVESVSVKHDDRQMLAEIDLTFVENLRTVIDEVAYEEVLTAIEVAVQKAQDQQQEELAQELADEGLDTETELDEEMSLLDQVKAGTAYLRDLTKGLDAMIGKAEGTLNEIMQPVNSLISTINYAANLPGRILGPITKAVERVAKLYTSIIGFPDRFSRNLRFELNKLIKSFEVFGGSSKGSKKARAIMVKHLKIASAQILVLELAASYKADQQARAALTATEGAAAFDSNGNWLNPDQPPAVATVNELEASLVTSRDMLQEAIDLARSISALRDMALALLNHVNRIKLDRENMVAVELDNPMPLHLICLRYGLSYGAAERILSVNPTVVNPNAATGEVLVYVR